MRSGLPTNPFSAARFAPGVLPWIDSSDDDAIADLFAKASAPRARHQILGVHGSGKSTLLRHLEARAAHAGMSVILFRGSQLRWSPLALARTCLPCPRLLLVDEVEELGGVARLLVSLLARFANSDAAVVVSAHRDMGLPTLARCHVDARVARGVIDQLLTRSPAAAAAPAVAMSLDDIDQRLVRHDHNLREVLFELYDEAELTAHNAHKAHKANVLSTAR